MLLRRLSVAKELLLYKQTSSKTFFSVANTHGLSCFSHPQKLHPSTALKFCQMNKMRFNQPKGLYLKPLYQYSTSQAISKPQQNLKDGNFNTDRKQSFSSKKSNVNSYNLFSSFTNKLIYFSLGALSTLIASILFIQQIKRQRVMQSLGKISQKMQKIIINQQQDIKQKVKTYQDSQKQTHSRYFSNEQFSQFQLQSCKLNIVESREDEGILQEYLLSLQKKSSQKLFNSSEKLSDKNFYYYQAKGSSLQQLMFYLEQIEKLKKENAHIIINRFQEVYAILDSPSQKRDANKIIMKILDISKNHKVALFAYNSLSYRILRKYLDVGIKKINLIRRDFVKANLKEVQKRVQAIYEPDAVSLLKRIYFGDSKYKVKQYIPLDELKWLTTEKTSTQANKTQKKSKKDVEEFLQSNQKTINVKYLLIQSNQNQAIVLKVLVDIIQGRAKYYQQRKLYQFNNQKDQKAFNVLCSSKILFNNEIYSPILLYVLQQYIEEGNQNLQKKNKQERQQHSD